MFVGAIIVQFVQAPLEFVCKIKEIVLKHKKLYSFRSSHMLNLPVEQKIVSFRFLFHSAVLGRLDMP